MRLILAVLLALVLLAATGKVGLVLDAISTVHNSGGVFDSAQKAIR